jgi:NADPH2:quinone reductase
MNVVRIHAPGGADVLTFETVPTPSPGPGQVLIEVEAAGINFIDIYQRTGLYKVTFPFVLGQEAAGTIAAVGPDVNGFRVGDRVAAYAGALGAYAQLVLAPAERVIGLPEGVTTRQGAAVLLQGLTAHYLAHSTYPLKPHDTCLIHAAAGGVGLLLVQIAKRRGARVIATASTEAKLALVREMGADEVIRYTQQDFSQEVMRLTGGVGVDVVYDSVGRDTFDGGLRCLAVRGMMVLFGQSSGAVPPLDPQVLNQRGLFLTRPSPPHYLASRAELEERAGALFAWLRDGSLQLRIAAEFPLRGAPEAHRALEGRLTSGKLLLLP